MYLGEAEDISGLDIPVHPAAGVQLLQFFGNVRQSLQACGCLAFICPFLPCIA